jgi:predicted outer membrane repeat protein
MFVDDDAVDGGDGGSWSGAYKHLADAIASAQAIPEPRNVEIRVGQGMYVPDRSTAFPAGSGLRSESFKLVKGLALRGGFAGLTAPLPDSRNAEAFLTILSGDLAGNDGQDFVNNDENSLTVVNGSGADASAVLEGFIITGGNADDATAEGGALVVVSGNPTIRNCVFDTNSAFVSSIGSGGACFLDAADPTFVGCVFVGNLARFGGAIANVTGSSPTFYSCRFLGNGAAQTGGAVDSESTSQPIFVNCTFTGNFAVFGGAVHSGNNCSSAFYSCTITENSASGQGGAIYALAGNSNSPSFENCIVWNNSPNQLTATAATASFSDIQGTWPGTGNINADPGFIDPDGLDDVLGTIDDDLTIQPGSPCADAGDNTLLPLDDVDLDGDGDTGEPLPYDVDGSLRVVDDPFSADSGNGGPPVVDIGAHEVLIDCNGNGLPDADDISGGTSFDVDSDGTPDECQADCNGNGLPDDFELASGAGADCNGNSLPDDCDIAAMTSFDCNGNGVPDECETDCNCNGIDDAMDLLAGTSFDCNTNGIPDDCDTEPQPFRAESPVLSPIGTGVAQIHTVRGPPDAVSEVAVTLEAVGDLDGIEERLFVFLNGENIGAFFAGSGEECPEVADADTVMVPAETYNLLLAGGDAVLLIVADSSVSPDLCLMSTVLVRLTYTAARFGLDCNRNGVPDGCDIADGKSMDENGNGLPDECEVPPCTADINGDGSIDVDDLVDLILNWGVCVDCAADLDGDDLVGVDDLVLLILGWGPCPTGP